MEFKITNNILSKAILEVSRAISFKNNHAILTGIKMEATSDQLTLIGRNADFTIKKTIPVSSELSIYKNGSVVVSAKYIGEIIRKLPNVIHIKASSNQSVIIESDDITTTINGFQVEEYPSLPEFNLRSKINISAKKLISTIKQTVFATSKTGTQPALTGVNFLFQQDRLTCVATNSQRLSLKILNTNSDMNESIIVPSHTLMEFVKLFTDYHSEIEILISHSYIVFQSSTTSLYSKLIEGKYPNVTSLISQDASTVMTINTKKFLQGIERASVFASGMKNNNIKVHISEESTIVISSGTSAFGQIEEKQQIINLTGQKDLTITFDGNFMMEALEAIIEDEVKIYFNGSLRPILLVPVGNDSHIQLVSPVRS